MYIKIYYEFNLYVNKYEDRIHNVSFYITWSSLYKLLLTEVNIDCYSLSEDMVVSTMWKGFLLALSPWCKTTESWKQAENYGDK
jgi:hypothetical protein